MGWEKRGGRRYYIRKRWIAGHVVNEYVGGGAAGAVAAAEDQGRRDARVAAAATRRAEQDRLDAEDRAAAEGYAAVEALAHAALVAAGFHRHSRGAWIRRHEPH
jgi:hypothetical protein